MLSVKEKMAHFNSLIEDYVNAERILWNLNSNGMIINSSAHRVNLEKVKLKVAIEELIKQHDNLHKHYIQLINNKHGQDLYELTIKTYGPSDYTKWENLPEQVQQFYIDMALMREQLT